MQAIILGCGSLLSHIEAAQAKMQTDFPVVELDRKYHVDPRQMQQEILTKLQQLPAEVDTVLVAMGFCGGSWQGERPGRRLVMPRVDDCVTLLLHTDDSPNFNLKQGRHFYLRDSDRGEHSLAAMQQRLCEQHGEEQGAAIFRSWFANYREADIIDTGAYDSQAADFLAEASQNAELAGCRLNHVPGSNLLLEKLVSGRWDEQFVVVEPGQAVELDLCV